MSALLKLKKINLKYQTGKDSISVLKNIDLNIKKKETVSVVGESGSGKTSLIMLIGGLEKPTSGKIIFNDQDITVLIEDEVSEIRKKNIGIIFQSFYLIPNYTAVENVALTLELNNFKNPEKEAKILLDRFGLKHRFNNLPSQLSGGEQQRVCIARALVREPDLLLMDEPFSNLDSGIKSKIKSEIYKILKETNTTTILVTHDIKDTFDISDKILIFKAGIVQQYDNPEEMYCNPVNCYCAEILGDLNKINIDSRNLFIRPENINLVEKSKYKIKVEKISFLGKEYKIQANLNGDSIYFYNSKPLKNSKNLFIDFNKDDLIEFDKRCSNYFT